MTGDAVVDVETTGLFPTHHDRIIEIAIVHVAPCGTIESSWTTLLNPGRDLGPQSIHGVTAADVLYAPTFAQVAGVVADLLIGRVFVAHNASFDRRFVQHAFSSLGHEVPIVAETSLCTMQWASRFLPGAPRSLAGCCGHAGVELGNAHEALADATAAAGLLRHYLTRGGPAPMWDDVVERARTAPWPAVPRTNAPNVRRGVAAERAVPFLSALVDHLPRTVSSWEQEQYLALLDRALLDRVLSVREQEALVATAGELGIDQPTALTLHLAYLASLARAAMADGVVTDDERADLEDVARLLDLDASDVNTALDDCAAACPADPLTDVVPAHFSLRPGDVVVFTGDMALPRGEWISRACAAGLLASGGVTKKVALVIAADPDSLSGKARKALDYGIPIVTESAFGQMLDGLLPATLALERAER